MRVRNRRAGAHAGRGAPRSIAGARLAAAQQHRQAVHQHAEQQHPEHTADLVADRRVPERRVGILKERQRDVVAAERCAEDARKLVEAVGDVAELGLEIVGAALAVGEARARSARAAPERPPRRSAVPIPRSRLGSRNQASGISSAAMIAVTSSMLATADQSTDDQSAPNRLAGSPPPVIRPATNSTTDQRRRSRPRASCQSGRRSACPVGDVFAGHDARAARSGTPGDAAGCRSGSAP